MVDQYCWPMPDEHDGWQWRWWIINCSGVLRSIKRQQWLDMGSHETPRWWFHPIAIIYTNKPSLFGAPHFKKHPDWLTMEATKLVGCRGNIIGLPVQLMRRLNRLANDQFSKSRTSHQPSLRICSSLRSLLYTWYITPIVTLASLLSAITRRYVFSNRCIPTIAPRSPAEGMVDHSRLVEPSVIDQTWSTMNEPQVTTYRWSLTVNELMNPFSLMIIKDQ